MQKEDIAIVGIGCHTPGQIHGPEQFWEKLMKGVNGITEIPKERWDHKEYYDPDPNKAGKIKTNKGGFIEGIDLFDNEFFKIFPKEAERIDPQQRLLLQTTFEAIEDAGEKLDKFNGSNTAVFMSLFTNDYWDNQVEQDNRYKISPHVTMGSALTAIANRISYFFNLKGPSISIDTACSGSLVSVHLACQSIWDQTADSAVAGGVNIIINPESTLMLSKGNFLSPDGYCKSFDEKANGYVRSEGVGVVYLKKLKDAERDNNKIYGIIKATSCNSDGYTSDGFTVPSESAQTKMLKTAYALANIDVDKLQYIEAHGTGTAVGDPIETKSFANVFGQRSADTPLMIGSVKSNIGHLEGTAGVAGLIKLVLSIKNKKIPGNLHFNKINPKIDLENWKLKVVSENTDWPAQKDGSPRIGGVNSFGAGGTNAHVVVQEYIMPTQAKKVDIDDQNMYLFHTSAETISSLQNLLREYAAYLLSSAHSLKDICYNIGKHRSDLRHRIAIAGIDAQDIVTKIEAYLEGNILSGVVINEVDTPAKKVGFVFTGQGPQWFAMGQELIASEPLFKSTIQKIEGYFKEIAGWSLLEEMNKDEENSRVNDTRIAQPAIMSIQIALVELWKKHGVTPQGVVGHSIGEVAAAYTSGALTLEQAVQVIFHRSRGQHAATGKGKMLAVSLSQIEAEELIKDVTDRVSIGALNGPKMAVLSGDEEPLIEIAEQLEKKDIFNKFLRVTVPFHSHHMEPLKDELISSLSQLQPSKAKIDLYSTVTGKMENGLHLVSEYWYDNVREPVYFSNALSEMVNDGYDIFIEIGPHPALSPGAEEVFSNKDSNASIFPSIKRMENEKIRFLQTLGSLYTKGINLDWDSIYPHANNVLDLPKYKWDLKSFWYESSKHQSQRTSKRIHPLVKDYSSSGTNEDGYTFNFLLDRHIDPYIDDHKVDDVIIFPATGHLEMAIAAAQQAFGEDFGFLEDINFESALFLPEEGEFSEVKIEVYSEEKKYWVLSRDKNTPNAKWVKHSNGKMNTLGDKFNSTTVDLEQLKERIYDRLPVQPMYLELKKSGLYYGATFKAIKNLWVVDNEILSKVNLHESLEYGIEDYNLHPCILDACLHTIFAANLDSDVEERGIYLPTHIDRYKFHTKPKSSDVYSYVMVSEASAQYLKGDFCILDEDGTLIAEIQGLHCKYIEGSRTQSQDVAYSGCYEYNWIDAPDFAFKPAKNKVLMIAENDFSAEKLEKELVENGTTIIRPSINDFSDRDTVREAIVEIKNNHPTLNRIVITLPVSEKRQEIEITAVDLSWKVLNIFNAIIEEEMQLSVWLINEQADRVVDSDQSINILQSVSFGLGRVMFNEYPLATIKIADLADLNNEKEASNLAKFISSTSNGGEETDFAFRGEKIFVKRLLSVEKEKAQESASESIAASGSYYHTILQEKGVLDSIKFIKTGPSQLGEEEIEIDVKAAGINSRDIFLINGGMQDQESIENQLGSECSGVITRVGHNVTKFSVGDAVICFTSQAFAGKATAPQHCVTHKPDHLSFEEASCISYDYLTAYYSMFTIGQLEAGERVLIHSATDDVGLAAIALAQMKGLEIYTTADSDQKRATLQTMGVKNVYDSLSTSFYDTVMQDSDGGGVDLVLNSLNGKSIVQSIKCLRDFGRFIDIGSTDVSDETSLSIKRSGKNLSYTTINIEKLMKQKPQKAARLFQKVTQLFAIQSLSVGSFQTFKIGKIKEAIELKTESTHVGKVVLSMEDTTVHALPMTRLSLSPDLSYVVTGGASGFGLEMAKFLANRGAKNLVMVSRSGAKTDYDKNWISKLQEEGVNISIEKLDLSHRDQVQEMISRVNSTLPIGGLVHSAGIIDDSTIQGMDKDLFKKVFIPKAIGAWNLHLATESLDLDFFLTLSSISAVVGFPGQSNYSSANNFLDKLAIYRRSKGLNAQSVNLGVLGNFAGMSKDAGNLLNVLENQGWNPLTLHQVTSKVETMLLEGAAVRMTANIDWLKFREFFYHLKNDAKLNHLLSDENLKVSSAKSSSDSLRDQIITSNGEALGILTINLKEALARILGTVPDKLDENKSISAIGLDSLMMNQLRNWMLQKLEFNYPLMKISKGPSIVEMSNHIIDSLRSTGTETGVANDESGISTEEDIEVINKWFVHKKNEEGYPSNNIKLFMFHSMGAGASMFNDFMYDAPLGTDVYAVQMPGRENRKKEGFFSHIEDLLEDLEQSILPLLDGPFAFFGHSFGGIVAFELTRILRAKHGKEPIRFFSSATMAPQMTHTWKNLDVMAQTTISSNSEQKLLGLMTYIDDIEYVKKILPIMRLDMALLINYDFVEADKFNCPITVFSAIEDEVTLPEEMTPWQEHTTAEFKQELVHGDHWFVSRNKDFIRQRISADLKLVLVEN
ncbi:SDR family NAD(P)-dependent oxidoreductase [Reichenbachiella agarivorans]|uniref:SDR family NAD(P)-dependent oxidoreductase n=1 Tax=Reichenbachiella agarivorans TaxID=2979464 RepID=A0ABY6CU85_9BACT|nr:type I polyketide synthase [Reichenbachiella agarivorans]UXP34082.1 SDR family NAD(P)-dependent oxidoreductase [Reichenbachiella agarivorans]